MADTRATKRPLLIVEDDEAAIRQLRWTFDDFELTAVSERPEALERFRGGSFPVVLLDLGLPPDAEGATEGLATLREIMAAAPDTKVIVVTGREEQPIAVDAVRLGAWDYCHKPIDPAALLVLVERAFRLHALEIDSRRVHSISGSTQRLPGVVASSSVMHQVADVVERAARSSIRILLLGESGVGKEVIARALHQLSDRAEGPFVAINTAAIPANLLESELFGHERGAFTGAHRAAPGRIELADGGTMLLDEIGDMPLDLQVKLLRFLGEGVHQRVGGREDIASDVRIVAATHQDLKALAASGQFRKDLYYRLAELIIEIPPLRDRPEDTRLLAEHFFARYRDEAAEPIAGITREALTALAAQPWPGNVRELENRVKRAIVMARGTRITSKDLDLDVRAVEEPLRGTLNEALDETERRLVEATWRDVDGNVSLAARQLGISRPTLYKLLKKHGIER